MAEESTENSSSDECYICYDATTAETGKLIAVCPCSRGGMLAHQNCVKSYIEASHDKRKICRACHCKYNYTDQAPTFRTTWLKLDQIIISMYFLSYLCVSWERNKVVFGGAGFWTWLVVIVEFIVAIVFWRFIMLAMKESNTKVTHNENYTILPTNPIDVTTKNEDC